MIHVCYISDYNYLKTTLLSMHSMFKHLKYLKYGNTIKFHLIYNDDVNDKKFIKMIDSMDYLPIEIHQSNYDNYINGIVKQSTHVSKTALLKFLIPEILKDLDRVIYIDGDTYIKRDITPLWQHDLGPYDIAAVKDLGMLKIWRNEKVPQIKNNTYFQSGLLLMNLNNLRKIEFSKTAIKCKLEKFSSGGFMDQGVFNEIFNGNVSYLSPIYSCPIHKMIQGDTRYFDVRLLNEVHKTNYGNIFQFIMDSVVFHFHGKKDEMLNNVYLNNFFKDQVNETPLNLS